MICIFTGEDCAQCNCAACGPRRGVPYQPSRCANGCTCCAWCRGEVAARPDGTSTVGGDVPPWCTCPSPSAPVSNCERGHSALVECRGGCKPRPVPMAVVVQQTWGESVLVKLWGAIRSLARWRR